jgi:hypothetical protein
MPFSDILGQRPSVEVTDTRPVSCSSHRSETGGHGYTPGALVAVGSLETDD